MVDVLRLALRRLDTPPPARHRQIAETRAVAIEAAWWAGALAWTCPGPRGPLFVRVVDAETMRRLMRAVRREVE